MKPLISIITITYNAESVISPTLNSLKKQSFTNFEHIIVDGASSDNTIGLVRAAETPNCRIISEPDKGLYDAMNKGIRQANGKYLLFLNAGDAFHSDDSLQLYAQAAEDNPDIIYGDTNLVDADRNFVAPRHLSVPKKLTFESFKQGMLVCHQAFMVRREIAPLYDLQFRFSADYEWCLRCLKQSSPEKCVNLNRVVIDYLTEGLTDKNHKKSLKERYSIMCKYYSTIPTMARHIGFIIRYIVRKISHKVLKKGRIFLK